MTIYSHPSSATTAVLECPNCGKHSIVQHKETRYVCLSCNWEKDIAPEPSNQSGETPPFSLPFWLSTGLLIALVI